MTAIRAKVTGIKEVDVMLNSIDKRLSARFIKQGFRKAAKPLVKAAKQKAPSNTGLLRKSIGVKNARDKDEPGVLVMPIQSKRFQAATTKTGKATHKLVSNRKIKQGVVKRKDTTRSWYAHFLTGTKLRQTKRGRANRGSISGSNYMKQAYNETYQLVRDGAGDFVLQAAVKEARKRGFKG